jgi:hypothetical protein
VIGGLLGAVGLFFVRLGRLAQGFDRQIAAEGTDGEAEVTDHRTVHGRGSRSYYITFKYTVSPPGAQPETLTTDAEISSEDYQQLNVGDKVAIRYMPKAPKEVILSGAVRDRTSGSLLITGYGAMAVGAAAALIGLLAWLR